MLEIKQSSKKQKRQRTIRKQIVLRKDGGTLMDGLLAHFFSSHKSSFPSMMSRSLYNSTHSSVKILAVIGRTPGRRHYICQTNVGILRKPIEGIPSKLIQDFRSIGF